ncbi:MAG: hypothetical protein P8Y71_23265 [Pseudolabrys sp.]
MMAQPLRPFRNEIAVQKIRAAPGDRDSRSLVSEKEIFERDKFPFIGAKKIICAGNNPISQ